MSRTVRLFISYSATDADLIERFKTHIALMEKQKLIEVWSDRPILANQSFQGIVDARLESADIVVLLVTPSFIASSYCYEGEMARALELHRQNEVRVIPVLGRPGDLTGAPFAHLRGLPSNGVPITKWRDADSAWTDVTQGLRQVVDLLKDKPLREGGSSPSQVQPVGGSKTAPSPNDPVPSSEDLLEDLLRLPPAAFSLVVFYTKANPTTLSPPTVPLAERALELVGRCESLGEGGLRALAGAIRQARGKM